MGIGGDAITNKIRPNISFIYDREYLCHLHLGDFDTPGGVEDALDVTVDGELSSGQCAHHDQTSTETSEETNRSEISSHFDQSRGDGLTRQSTGLVDLRQEGVGRLRDDGGSETSNETSSEVETGDGSRAQFRFRFAGQ